MRFLYFLSGSSSTGSPKTHTGLKPGVNSGPASKKPQQVQKNSSNLTNTISYNSSSSSGVKGSNSSTKISSSSTKMSSSSVSGSSSTSKSSSKLSGSPKISSPVSDFTKSSKDRVKSSKSSSEKSIFSSMKEVSRKSSPTPNREDAESIYKLSQASIMEGMMKQLDKNFQIPKLSARALEDKRTTKNEAVNSINRNTVDSKVFDMIQKNDLPVPKYPVAIPGDMPFDNSMESKIKNNMNDINQINLAGSEMEGNNGKKEYSQNMSGSQSGYQKDEIKNS